MELKSCSNPSGFNVEGFNPGTDCNNNSKLSDDTKNYISENYFCTKGDLDSELEKCYKILDLESPVELKSCSSECNIPGKNFELLEDTKNNFSLKSGLDSELEKCYEILDLASPLELKCYSNPSKCSVEVHITGTDSNSKTLLDDGKHILMENNNCLKSGLECEFEKCYKVLDLEPLVELKDCSNLSKCDVQGFLPETDFKNSRSELIPDSPSVVNNIDNHGDNFNSLNEISDKNLDPLSSNINYEVFPQEIDNLKSKTDFEGDTNTSSSILNMNKQQILHPKSDLNSLNKFHTGSKKTKSSSSLDFHNFNAGTANNDVHFKSKKEILSADPKILINKTECPSKEPKPDAFLNNIKTSNEAITSLDSQTYNAKKKFDVKNKEICSDHEILLNKTECPSKESMPSLKNDKTHETVNLLDSQTFKADKANNNFDVKNMNEISPDHEVLINETECPIKESKSDASSNNKISNGTVTVKREMLNEDELKNNRKIKDYLEEEKDDLINPEWDEVKKLTTNEQRYQQVRKCWESRKIPDPNKNLTYHSYRKRLFNSRDSKPKTATRHKRQASTQLNEKGAKRHCTFFLDKEIDTTERKMEKEKQAIIDEMNGRISSMGYQDSRWRNAPSYHHPQFNPRVSMIQNEYFKIAGTCEDRFNNKISQLSERRNEVLKFYSFYRGLNDSNEDPTQLTESQFQELNEIEDVYRQFGIYYKD